MSKIILYHGSNEKIERPIFGKGKVYNDYGQGFYCTEHIELAKDVHEKIKQMNFWLLLFKGMYKSL